MKSLLPLFLGILLLASCARYVNTSTNTFAERSLIPCGFKSGSSFAIVSENNDKSLLSKEVGNKIGDLLMAYGFSVKERINADYVLNFHFGELSDRIH